MSTNLHIDDIGNLILRDGKLGLCVSSQNATPPHYGGGRVGGLSLYAVEQVNHYYAYGGIIDNLSSNEGLQEFMFGDKKLDRTYGLDLYDFEARQYDAITPWFTSIDPLAEKYYSISPYVYCADNPVNFIDPDGKRVDFAGNKELEKKNNEARAYAQSIGASEYIDKIFDSEDFVVTILPARSLGENGYTNRKDAFHQGNWNEGIIYWDPTIAKETNTGYVMSPVEGLNHEAMHAVDDLAGGEKGHEAHKKKITNANPTWKNQSEQEACKEETKFAEKMGKLGGKHKTTRTKYSVPEDKSHIYRVDTVDSSSTENEIIKK